MTVTLAVLGDSIAFGQGATHPTDTIGARLTADLVAAGTATDLHIFAVPGARSENLAAQVSRALPIAPDIALIVIGANDLTHFVSPQVAAKDLGAAVRELCGAGAQVVIAPAPDLSVVPHVPPQFRGLVQAGSALLREAQTRAALAAGARVAEVPSSTSAKFASDTSLFCADRFHPSSAGYALIADALSPAVRAAAADALRLAG